MFTPEEKELYLLINPYAKWSRPEETIEESKNEAARQALLDFYELLSMKKIDPIYRNNMCSRGHMEYFYYLYHIREALGRKKYTVACNEIVSFLYYEPFFQGRNITNIMLLLRQYLDIKGEDAVMPKSKFKFRGRKKEPIADEEYMLRSPGIGYRNALEFINITLEDKENSEKEDLLNYYMTVIRQDIQSDYLTAILYRNEYFDQTIMPLFPTFYYDEVGNMRHALCETYQQIDLASNDFTVITFPWRQDSLVDAILGIFKKKFEFDQHDHDAIYYKGLGVVCVKSGKHSISAALVKREGQISTNVYDICELYPHVKVDKEGRKWINLHNEEVLTEVRDFRLALLYELSKLRQEIINN